jgi:tRNA(Met) C34 N-acetyltransferase TmcA
MDELRHLTAQMAREGVRRLLVLSGDDAWTLRQAQRVRTALAGDGLWVGPRPMPEPYVSSAALKSLLGREFQHAFFDAREGFDVAAFAALAGTLRAGSWLVLLTPDFAQWPARPDADSLRWSDAPDPIPRRILFIVFANRLVRITRPFSGGRAMNLRCPRYPCARHGIPPTVIRRRSRLPCLPNWPGSLPVLRR